MHICKITYPHKIILPQRPLHLVSRPRLIQLLETALDRRLITISAPAGYGKTSLLLDFAHTSAFPICWYTLDPFDQDVWTFLEYLTASIERRFAGALQHVRSLLDRGEDLRLPTVLTALARDIFAINTDFVIIFDDWQLVGQSSEITEVIHHLLHRCPNCHIVLASRSYPSLPNIMLLAARRQMSSIDEQHLRFTLEEASAVIRAESAPPISTEGLQTLIDRANGWIAGILLSLQADTPPPAITAGAAAERQVYRFLAEQVFDQQPDDLRAFLLDTSLLDEITPEVCDAVFKRNDSRRYLEQILRRHLFIMTFRPGVLRYHSLFREFLQEQFRTVNPERYAQMMLRIADHHAAQQQWLLAFDVYVAAGRPDAAHQVIRSVGEQFYAMGRLNSLEHWFEALPQGELDVPLLCLKARVLLERGKHQEAQALAQLAEIRMQASEKSMVLLLQAQIARITGQYELGIELAEQTLRITADLRQCATALRTIAICYHRTRRTDLATQRLQEAIELERQRGDLNTIAQLHRDLSICYKDIGLLAQAETACSYADAHWAATGNLAMRTLSLNTWGNIQLLAGNYDAAHDTLVTALRYAREAAVPDYEAIVLSSLGDLYRDLQLWDNAVAAYRDGRQLGGSAYTSNYLQIADIHLLVRRRDYAAAERALYQLPESFDRRYHANLLWLRGYVAWGRGQYEQADDAIQHVITLLEQQTAAMDLARAYLLQSQIWIYTHPVNPTAFLEPLDKAVAIAEQLGHSNFLVAEALALPGVLRWAATAHWSHAQEWRQRQQSLLTTAETLAQADSRPALMVRTLGIDQIALNGRTVKLGWHKACEVFYCLLAHPAGVSIDTLRELIWPDLKTERSSEALRTAIYQLRSVLPRELIVLCNRRTYQLDRSVVRLDYDVERFLAALDQNGEDLEELIAVIDFYRGPYLVAIDSLWCADLRSHLEQRFLQALHQSAARLEAQQRVMDALLFYQRIISCDNLDEAGHTGVMRCHIALQNRAAAIHQYQRMRQLLDDELGIDPGAFSDAERLYRTLIEA